MKRIKEGVRGWKVNGKSFGCVVEIRNEVDREISGWMK